MYQRITIKLCIKGVHQKLSTKLCPRKVLTNRHSVSTLLEGLSSTSFYCRPTPPFNPAFYFYPNSNTYKVQKVFNRNPNLKSLKLQALANDEAGQAVSLFEFVCYCYMDRHHPPQILRKKEKSTKRDCYRKIKKIG